MINDYKEVDLNILKKEVNFKPSFRKYAESTVRENTNCYSHALGCTFPELTFYRVGHICGKKPIDEDYKSIPEIKKLLFEDCEMLNLKIKECSLGAKLCENEYKIALYVRTWGNGHISYHFFRNDYGEDFWTEKWKGQTLRQVQELDTGKHYFYWEIQGIYKITRPS